MAAVRLPDVNCRYGAPMGRRSLHLADRTEPIRFKLGRVAMVEYDCYDSGGAYWGNGGGTLYVAQGDGLDEHAEVFVRAYSRDQAKARIRADYPNATFYR